MIAATAAAVTRFLFEAYGPPVIDGERRCYTDVKSRRKEVEHRVYRDPALRRTRRRERRVLHILDVEHQRARDPALPRKPVRDAANRAVLLLAGNVPVGLDMIDAEQPFPANRRPRRHERGPAPSVDG